MIIVFILLGLEIRKPYKPGQFLQRSFKLSRPLPLSAVVGLGLFKPGQGVSVFEGKKLKHL